MAEGLQSRCEPPVFAVDPEPVDHTGTLSVLGHRALNTLSSAGLAIAVVQSCARTAEDELALAACRRVEQLLREAVQVIRDDIVLGARSSVIVLNER
jgi:hypothetical protein